MSSGAKSLLRDVIGCAILCVLSVVVLTNMVDLEKLREQAADYPANAGIIESPESEPTPALASYGTVRIKRGRGGHYRTQAYINKRPVNVLVDTGATLIALSHDDARRAGIHVRPSDFTIRTRTANGIARAAPVILNKVRIGNITLNNVRGTVSQPGALNMTLLGMSFLGRLDKVEIRSGDLVLQK